MSAASGLARRFVAAVTARDLGALRALLTDDAVFWTNATMTDVDRETRLTQIAHEFRTFERIAFENARIDDFGTGFVLRARARGVLPGGAQFAFPICMVADTRNGRVRRLEEYFDPAAARPALNAL